jgi:hypothetical protein
MDYSHDTPAQAGRTAGSSFRRVGATVAVACALTGSIMGLGAMGALASPGSSPTNITAFENRETGEVTEQLPKVTYTDVDLAAFAASPYAADALNLAAIWGTTSEEAQGKAGSKIQAGLPLPYAPGESASIEYTTDQKVLALQTESDFTDALRLAATWNSDDIVSAKAELGGLLLAHQPLPVMPAEFTEEQKAHAFRLWGYTDADAVQLAGLWQTDTQSAVVRAGAEILAGNYLPL